MFDFGTRIRLAPVFCTQNSPTKPLSLVLLHNSSCASGLFFMRVDVALVDADAPHAETSLPRRSSHFSIRLFKQAVNGELLQKVRGICYAPRYDGASVCKPQPSVTYLGSTVML